MVIMTSTPLVLCLWVLGMCHRMFASDLYTSSVQVQRLLNSERSLLVFLEKYFTSYVQQTSANKRILRSVQSDLDALPETSSAGHPLDAVIGLHRYHGYVEKYLKLLPRDMLRKVEAALENSGLTLPNNSTLSGSEHGLFRLQSTYNLTSRSLVTSSNVNITATQCLTLATVAEKAGLKRLAFDWLEMAENLPDFKNKQVQKHRNELEKICRKRTKSKPEADDNLNIKTLTGGEEFEKLCTKHIDKTTLGSTSRSSRCKYITGVPLRRWKTEELSHDPLIVLYHDVISPKEADVFIQLGSVVLKRAATGESPEKASLHDGRTSKVAWLWDNHTATIDTVSRRVAEITGLHTEYRDTATFAEPFQVVNYGIGGHYAPHFDYYVNPETVKKSIGFSKNSGDRMATFMFYLTEVEGGGATVFPDLGIGAPPIKYAALFWHNFRPDGTPDPRSRHGGCPVLYGHKWVANKWIRQISGAMTLSCTTKPSPG